MCPVSHVKDPLLWLYAGNHSLSYKVKQSNSLPLQFKVRFSKKKFVVVLLFETMLTFGIGTGKLMSKLKNRLIAMGAL